MLCIKNGKLVTPTGIREADLYIKDDKIFSLGGYWGGAEVYDAAGCYVFPGFVDAHVHLGESCAHQSTAGGCAAATEAALAGGTTTVMDFASQVKGASLLEAVQTWGNTARGRCSCDFSAHLTVTDWTERTERELHSFPRIGITSFMAFMACDPLKLEDGGLLALLRAAADIGFVGVHCETGSSVKRGTAARLSAGDTRPVYHALSRPNKVEASAIRRCLELAGEAGVPVWITYLTTAEGLEEIRTARKRGQYVLAEVCPQYLTLTAEKLRTADEESCKYVTSPPLRSEADAAALWEALRNGEIQMISSGHCSFTLEDKRAGAAIDFAHIPAGLPTVQEKAALIWTEGVEKGRISAEQMAKLMAENPARAFGLFPRKGVLKTGSDADLVIWDPNRRSTVTAADSLSGAGYTPWEGCTVSGCAKAVFLRGVLSAANGSVLSFGRGKFISAEKVF